MAEPKIIAVLGATGAQGGGLVRAIQGDPGGGFRARALTRDIHSTQAKALAELGAEVVAADADHPDSLRAAFEGAYGAYCVTFFWDHSSPEREKAQAAAMAHAAKLTGLQHVIWSTLEDTRRWVPLEDDRLPTLMGKYKVPHFDAKGESDHFFTDAELPVTILLTSFYFENFINFGMGPQRGPDGTLAITFPLGDKKLPVIAAEDIGRCAYAIFQRGREFTGKSIGIAGEHLTGHQIAEAFTKALGEEVRYNKVSPTEYRRLGFPGAADLANMFQFKRDFEHDYCAAREVALTRALNPRLQTLEMWLEANKDRVPLKVGTAGA